MAAWRPRASSCRMQKTPDNSVSPQAHKICCRMRNRVSFTDSDLPYYGRGMFSPAYSWKRSRTSSAEVVLSHHVRKIRIKGRPLKTMHRPNASEIRVAQLCKESTGGDLPRSLLPQDSMRSSAPRHNDATASLNSSPFGKSSVPRRRSNIFNRSIPQFKIARPDQPG